MILVLAGTRDGRELAVVLADCGYQVIVSTVSQYGGVLAYHPKIKINVGALDTQGLGELIRNNDITYIVDATHPYAADISRNAMRVAEATGIGYLRYERPDTPLPDYNRLHRVSDVASAAVKAAELGQTIFLTTGSRTLSVFKAEPALKDHRLIARVLPDAAVLAECSSLGFLPKDIVAMQGPFTLDLNIALFQTFAADVVVTKNAGEIGGADAKIEAAVKLGLHLVVINRPNINYKYVVASPDEVISRIKKETN